MISVASIALLFARPINMIFTRDNRVIELGISFLFYRAPFWMLMGVRIMIGAGFNGAGKPRVGLLTLLFGLFTMGLPAALLLKSLMGLNAVWAGLSIANLTGDYCSLYRLSPELCAPARYQPELLTEKGL